MRRKAKIAAKGDKAGLQPHQLLDHDSRGYYYDFQKHLQQNEQLPELWALKASTIKSTSVVERTISDCLIACCTASSRYLTISLEDWHG